MKGLVRKVVSRRFPALGFDKQKKVEITRLFFSIMAQEAPAVWKETGGAKSLAKLGLVDPHLLDSEFNRVLGRRSGRHSEACKVFDVMNMESWLTNRL